MVSFRSWAWLSVLNPAPCQHHDGALGPPHTPLLLYTNASLIITVRPFAVEYCFAFPRLSLKLVVSLTWLFGPTPPGTRKTWLARNSSEPLRSAYAALVSLSREVKRTSVIGTRRTWSA